eukprot:13195710-Alexandrium_andersonii.AAC.1
MSEHRRPSSTQNKPCASEGRTAGLGSRSVRNGSVRFGRPAKRVLQKVAQAVAKALRHLGQLPEGSRCAREAPLR